MKLRHKIKYGNIGVAVLWFMAISGGVAYASFQNIPNVMPGMGIPASPQQFAQGITALGQLLGLGNANATSNTGAHMQNDTDRSQGQILQTLPKMYADIVRSIGYGHAQTPGAGQQQAMLIKANEASEQVYQAADDLANGMALAIITEYDKSPAENIAELVEEGSHYGYLTPRGYVNADARSFSLISKAYASTGGSDDAIYALPSSGTGTPVNIQGFNSKYGVSCGQGGSSAPIDKDSACGRLFGAKLAYVHGLPGRPQCSPSNDCDTALVEWGAERRRRGEKLAGDMHRLAWNARVGSVTQTADNSDPPDHANHFSSFFISPAYAVTGQSNSGGQIETLVGKLQSAQQTGVQAHQKVNQLVPQGQYASANEFAHASSSGASNSIDWHSQNAATGTVSQSMHVDQIRRGADDAWKAWDPFQGG